MVDIFGYTDQFRVFNRVHEANLEIKFEDLISEEKFVISTSMDGFFYKAFSDSSTIRMIGVKIEQTSEEVDGNTLNRYDLTKTYTIDRTSNIQSGKVNNLGLLLLIDRYESGLKFNLKYEEVRPLFAENYEDSLWNEAEWIDIP